MMRQILLYIFISFFACSLCAEQFKITGKVVDTSENNEPLIAATVEIKGTDRRTFTDIDGNFSIEVEKGAILRFDYLGFFSQEVEVLNDSSLFIELVLKKEDDEIDIKLSGLTIRCYPVPLPDTIDFWVSESKLKRAQQRGRVELFQLNDAQIEMAKSLLAEELKKEKYGYFHNLIPIPIDRYTKQYLGVKHKGHEKVLINYFSPGLVTYLEEHRASKSPILSNYGGNTLVRAAVDLTTEHILWLELFR
ncbi:MAG: carboxypeptidase-like regulatory domain-containing protein [Muribaculaceae bacterium]|nr:carboxypeptidase-like regulatory domain-containing protein [Muribaculaceae bacterium]